MFPPAWVLPYLVVQFAGAISASLFLQWMFGHIAAGGTYPIDSAGGDWRSFVMEILLTAMLISVILHTATGSRSIGHNAALAVGATIALLGTVRQPDQWRVDDSGPFAGSGHRGQRLKGWWVYALGPLIGALIAVMIIGLVRGLPGKAERVAAEGGALPL